MRIDALTREPALPLSRLETHKAGESQGFAGILKSALLSVDNLQKEADQLTEAFVAGAPVEIHDVVLAAEKARLALDLTVSIRNKLVEAYQEIMRMQI
ncbi:MAG TPA: flagellar hook-basal body complex protein FliE [Firmicutes bacterium]|nr:flagellar hook-basal body complex protein FliE [Bacillota bacterium]